MPAGLEDKRRFPRVELKTPLRYQVRGSPESNNCVSDDISVGGIRCINNGFIAPSTNVMLEINLLSRVLNPVGRIAWASPLAHSERYRLGIEFIELGDSEKNYLSDYINMQRGRL
ncbi:MAG: PilZ domain-containing protein [Candidatus Omnitrophota bacterium]|jgi:hypothetical protein